MKNNIVCHLSRFSLFTLLSLHCASAAEDDRAGKQKSPQIDLLKLATMSPSGQKVDAVSPSRTVVPTKKAPPHPLLLTFQNIKDIFKDKHGTRAADIMVESKIDVEIGGQTVPVYARHKTFKESEIKHLLRDPSTPPFVGIFQDYLIENRGDAHTLASAGVDKASVPYFVFYYSDPANPNAPNLQAPVFDLSDKSKIYIGFAAESAKLPDIEDLTAISLAPMPSSPSPSAAGSSPSPTGTSVSSSPQHKPTGEMIKDHEKSEKKGKKEKDTKHDRSKKEKKEPRRTSDADKKVKETKGKEKERKDDPKPSAQEEQKKEKDRKEVVELTGNKEAIKEPKSAPVKKKAASGKPLAKISHDQLLSILRANGTAIDVASGNDDQDQYKVGLEEPEKKAALLTLLEERKNEYEAVLDSMVGASSVSQTLATQDQKKQLCLFKLYKKGIRNTKATAPADASLERPEDFYKFTLFFYTDS